MRSLIVTAFFASVAISTPAFAAAEEGPYVGVGITNGNFNGSDHAEGIGFGGVGATAFAGYNVPLGKLFAGVEADFDLSTADVGTKVTGIEVRHAFGASARLGYHLSEKAALYGRVGYRRTHVYDYVESVRNSERRNAIRFGAGLEAKVTSNIAVRIEYSHARHDRTTIDGVKAGVDNNQGTIGVVFGL